jgi:ABC-type nitrate/sulfonate/bicarbonate transport system substrate-binding protein
LGRVLAPVSQYEGKLAVGTLYASKRLIDTDPNTVRAFVAGWIETIDFIRTHKAETVKSASAPGKILSGEKPADLSVMQSTKFDFSQRRIYP